MLVNLQKLGSKINKKNYPQLMDKIIKHMIRELKLNILIHVILFLVFLS
jgi:hypothetical protein